VAVAREGKENISYEKAPPHNWDDGGCYERGDSRLDNSKRATEKVQGLLTLILEMKESLRIIGKEKKSYHGQGRGTFSKKNDKQIGRN